MTVDYKCAAVEANYVEQCSGATADDIEDQRVLCEWDYAEFSHLGCTRFVDEFVTCQMEDVDCDDPSAECSAEAVAMFDCQTALTQETGCSTLGEASPDCPSEAPYPFACLADIPDGCECVDCNQDFNQVCCPAFPER